MLEKAQSISRVVKGELAAGDGSPSLSLLSRRGFESTIFDPGKVELHRGHRETYTRFYVSRWIGSKSIFPTPLDRHYVRDAIVIRTAILLRIKRALCNGDIRTRADIRLRGGFNLSFHADRSRIIALNPRTFHR